MTTGSLARWARRQGRRAESIWSLSAATDRLESHLVDLVKKGGRSHGADLAR